MSEELVGGWETDKQTEKVRERERYQEKKEKKKERYRSIYQNTEREATESEVAWQTIFHLYFITGFMPTLRLLPERLRGWYYPFTGFSGRNCLASLWMGFESRKSPLHTGFAPIWYDYQSYNVYKVDIYHLDGPFNRRVREAAKKSYFF